MHLDLDQACRKVTVLVTGASGFIGRAVCNVLEQNYFDVIRLQRSTLKRGRSIQVDLADKSDLEKKLNCLPARLCIVHCAAVAHGERLSNGSIEVGDYNSLLTRNLFEVTAHLDCHWIFLSSVSVYGDVPRRRVSDDSKSLQSTDSYGRGKLSDEAFLSKNCKRLDVLRLAPVYDAVRLTDVRKRVCFPGTNLRVAITEPPLHSFAHLDCVTASVVRCLNVDEGKYLEHVCDDRPLSQAEIETWFSGPRVIVNRKIMNLAIKIFEIKHIKNLGIHRAVRKFSQDNIYDQGRVKLSRANTF